ncbi:MAG: hypothetical protein HWD59_07080 [Coxiellaceae bacterium]|nr:MAG: hypothetical protein HWD59_07080 [Coxiellaceae bacterium]
MAPEQSPQQYSISVKEDMTVAKPSFPFYTQLSPLHSGTLYAIPPYDAANQLPNIGKWMIAVQTGQKNTVYVPAHWLDDLNAKGQYIIEPINYIFVVYKNNPEQATELLKNALVKAGFSVKWSGPEYHSDNYHAYIGGTLVTQIKRSDGVFLTFSNNHWLKQNDHFRVMGPFQTHMDNKTAFIFVASVSEESAWSEKLNAGHAYVSFGHARDNLANALIQNGHPTYYVTTNNTLNTAKESTEDHDNKAFVTVFK